MAYRVKVVAMDKDGISKTAEKNIALGDAIRISVTPMSGPDSYPSILKVTAESVTSNINYIELPNGEKVEAQNGKFELKTTYNTTKNGPIVFTAYDKDGNVGMLEYDEQNVINFETEWTLDEETTITVPVTGTVDVYIDYGDGTKENVTTANPTHTYAAGTYTMKISGKCTNFSYNESMQNYLTKLKKWGCLENYSYAFGNNNVYKGANKLTGNIPTPFEKSFQKIGNFSNLFYYCGGLTGSIPANLFANCPNVTSFSYTFDRCKNLTGSIPANLFERCSNVASYDYTFEGCSGLTGTIPESLFKNCPKVTSFIGTFSGCTGLVGSIPERLFADNANISGLSYTFQSCKGLTNIPENLLINCENVVDFTSTFDGCKGISGIPAKLFANCTKATKFYRTFMSCENLLNIPENLFNNCTNVTDFSQTFYYCSNLTTIPQKLFANCTKVTDFSCTFNSCSKLTTIPENLFDNCQDVSNFFDTFYDCSELTGNAPELWNRTNVSSYSGCFRRCTKLTNYADIPDDWK